MPPLQPANHVAHRMSSPDPNDLLRRHEALIRRVASAFGRDASDREEIAQEALVQLWRSAARFDGRCRESTWVYRIALNVAISFGRRERRHRERRELLDESETPAASVPRDEPGAKVATLLEAVATLEPFDKALVLLHLDGNDHATIGDVLRITTSNVGTKLQRLRARLRATIERLARDKERIQR